MKIVFILIILYLACILCDQARLTDSYTAPDKKDDIRKFFKNGEYSTDIKQIPSFAKPKIIPFSGDYLAHRYGGASARFGAMDTRYKPYPISIGMYSQPADYRANRRRRDFEQYVNAYYSPAEKYDLLVGDYKFSFTRASKNFGRKYKGGGDFQTWMGNCDGLSPASYMILNPKRPVRVLAADGKTRIEFLPADIKALATIWWSNVNFDARFVGKRNKPIDAGSFFLIFGNQIGRYQKNMVFEPTADAEIWNFAVTGYRSSYYNVNNGAIGPYNKVRAPISSSNLRRIGNDKAKYLVGVNFTVIYAADIRNRNVKFSQSNKTKTSFYKMILYLDENDKIVAGRWASNKKPSFVWGPDGIPEGPFDKHLPTYTGEVSQLKGVAEYAAQSSAKLLPLREIVYYLAKKP